MPRRIATLSGHTQQISTCCINPVGSLIATGGDDGLRMWDAATGKPAAPVMFKDEPVSFAGWSQDGLYLIVAIFEPQYGGYKGRVRILSGSEPFMLLHEHRFPTAVYAAVLSFDGQAVVSACYRGARVGSVAKSMVIW